MSKNINVNDFYFRNDLVELTEAMQYAFGDQDANKNDNSQEKLYWMINTNTVRSIKDIKEKHAKELAGSPILLGLLDLYLESAHAEGFTDFKEIYDAYQNLQKDCAYEDHKQAYFDAGCVLTIDQNFDTNHVRLKYPIWLYSAYKQHGGTSCDTRGGYLFPVQVLTNEELMELNELNPEIIKSSPRVQLYFEGLKSKESQPNGN